MTTRAAEPPVRAPMIRAAGGVLWRPAGGHVEVALVHRPGHDDWSLPKGKLVTGEHPLAAACREVAEETGITPVAGPRLVIRHYRTAGGPKSVEYWAMRGCGDAFTPSAEVDELAWMPLEQARWRLSYPLDAQALDALGYLDATVIDSVILLVRNGQAVRPEQWWGDARQCPLDAAGRRQAGVLRRLLPAFGPSRLVSADCRRCKETIAPFASDSGMSVETETVIGEDQYAARPRDAVRRIRELARDGASTVICAQGTVIPHLVAATAREDRLLLLEGLRSERGSVWALFFSGGRLAAADYYPVLT